MTRRRQLDPDEPIPGQVPLWDELDAAVRGEVRSYGMVSMSAVLPPVLPVVDHESDPNLLYRAFCRCRVLVYVGVTNNLFQRMGTHAAGPNGRWASRVARWEWEGYPRRTRRWLRSGSSAPSGRSTTGRTPSCT